MSQQLQSMARTMERVVLPALSDDATFAKEQAGLVWATLGWLIDVHASEYRYEAAETADYRDLLERLTGLAGFDDNPRAGDIRRLLDTPAAGAGATDGDLNAVREQGRTMKQLAADFVATADEVSPELADATARLLGGVAERQAHREQAWYRMTGFTAEAPGDIASVLAADAER